jgi:cytochrome c-type biogenesis protein
MDCIFDRLLSGKYAFGRGGPCNLNLFSYVLTFVEGILTFVSPCILPMLPVYFIYLAGTANEEAFSDDEKRNKLIVNSIGFVIGFTIVFVLLGAAVTTLGHFLTGHRDVLRQISGILMILFGLNFMGILKLSFLNTERIIDFKFKKLRFLSSIVFGAVFGLGWTPCLGTFLGSAMALASNSKTVFQGITLLFVYSIGLGIPFVVSSIIFDRIKDIFKKIQNYNRIINIVSGSLLVVAGILVFTDILKYLI